MNKLKIAIFFGGCSSEYKISLASAYSVLRNLDSQKYNSVPIGISETGKWYYFTGDIKKIKQNCWLNNKDCIPTALSPNRNSRCLLLFHGDRVEHLYLDAAMPIMHGRYGEDGCIQGYIELSGIPLIGCGVLASALCMDKSRAHRLVAEAGISIPKSMVIAQNEDLSKIRAFGQMLGYPLFVKPVKSGSSYGITKVEKEEGLLSSVQFSFQYDKEVIIEEAIDGFEVGCAILGEEDLFIGEIDEIELTNDFFNFTEKYTLKTSRIHVPARVTPENKQRIKEAAKTIYRTLGCSGFARVDLFLTLQNKIVFNEVNTIPGFTEHSRYPKMMTATGLSFSEVLDKIIALRGLK